MPKFETRKSLGTAKRQRPGAKRVLTAAPFQSSLRDSLCSIVFLLPAFRFAPCRAKYNRRSAAQTETAGWSRPSRALRALTTQNQDAALKGGATFKPKSEERSLAALGMTAPNSYARRPI